MRRWQLDARHRHQFRQSLRGTPFVRVGGEWSFWLHDVIPLDGCAAHAQLGPWSPVCIVTVGVVMQPADPTSHSPSRTLPWSTRLQPGIGKRGRVHLGDCHPTHPTVGKCAHAASICPADVTTTHMFLQEAHWEACAELPQHTVPGRRDRFLCHGSHRRRSALANLSLSHDGQRRVQASARPSGV